MQKILIIGCGRTGEKLAKEFSANFNVTVLDKNPYALSALGEQFNGETIVGDALDLDVLEKAGIKEANILIIVTGNDNLNLVVGKIAKEMYKREKVLLQIYDYAKKGILSSENVEIIDKTQLLVEVFKKCIL